MSRYRLGTYLAGATVARTADEMSGPALLLLGLAVTGSARTAALLYAALTIAGGGGGPLPGPVPDRRLDVPAGRHPARAAAGPRLRTRRQHLLRRRPDRARPG